MRLLTAGSLVRVQLEEPLYRGIAQLVEHRSPKPSAVGSIPTAPANAAIAQSVECILGKDEVTSSNLVSSSILKSLVSLVNPFKQGFFVILYGFEHCCTKFLQLSHNVSHRRFLHFVNGTKCGTEQGG